MAVSAASREAFLSDTPRSRLREANLTDSDILTNYAKESIICK